KPDSPKSKPAYAKHSLHLLPLRSALIGGKRRADLSRMIHVSLWMLVSDLDECSDWVVVWHRNAGRKIGDHIANDVKLPCRPSVVPFSCSAALPSETFNPQHKSL